MGMKGQMTSVTKYSIEKRDTDKCIAQLLTPIQLNHQNTPSHRAACYGNYVPMFVQLKLTGRLPHMEALKVRMSSFKHSQRFRVIKQAISQYNTCRLLKDVLAPTRDFMRIVVIKDEFFSATNDFSWVDMDFLHSCIQCLIHQLKYLSLYNKDIIFECPVQSSSLRGYVDIFDARSKTVIEIKTCRFVKKEHFVQAKAYQRLLNAKYCYLLNCVDAGIWQL